jgi:predicted peroxiredoxin
METLRLSIEPAEGHAPVIFGIGYIDIPYLADNTMSKNVFVNFVSEPKNDVIKSIVGLACAAQAIQDGHQVSVFFAAAGTRLLDPAYIEELNAEMGADVPMVTNFMEAICSGATLYCSFASVKAVLGHSEGDGALFVSDDQIEWSGPPGVIALATAADVQLVY